MEDKRQALKDMMSMLKGEKQKKMQVMVAGNNPKAVKKGLETAEDVVEEMPGVEKPKMEMEGMESKGGMPMGLQPNPKVEGILSSLDMKDKKALFEKLMVEMEGMEDENKPEDEMSC